MLVMTAIGPRKDDPVRLTDLIRRVLVPKRVAQRIFHDGPIEARSGAPRASNGCPPPEQTVAAMHARLDSLEERYALHRLRTGVRVDRLRDGQ